MSTQCRPALLRARGRKAERYGSQGAVDMACDSSGASFSCGHVTRVGLRAFGADADFNGESWHAMLFAALTLLVGSVAAGNGGSLQYGCEACLN